MVQDFEDHTNNCNVTERNELIHCDLISFIDKAFRTVNPGEEYLHNWHIDLLAEYLEACENLEIKRLIINMPPRYLKSLCVTVAWPVWLLGHNPSAKIIAASYSQNLSIKHSLDSRNIIKAKWYKKAFPDMELLADHNRKTKFMTTSMGFRMATSVGGSVTGEGGDFLIVDDPHNATSINSKTIRENTLTWFDKTFSTRLNSKKKGVFVVVMQRLHNNDLTGHLLEKGGWEHLCIPAIAEKESVLHFGGVKIIRPEGGLLHPAREGMDEIRLIKRDLGSAGFNAQYQQHPAPEQGELINIDWFGRYRVAPVNSSNSENKGKAKIVQSWDTAIKTGQNNDFSVCTVWNITDSHYYLIEVVREKLEYSALKRAIINLAEKYIPQAILIEDKASGQSIIQNLYGETRLPIIPVTPVKDKISRLIGVLPIIEAGKVMLPYTSAWLMDFEQEIISFPCSYHDDQVDSLSQFLNWVSSKGFDGFRVRKL